MVIRTSVSGISVTSPSPVPIGRAGITLLLSGAWLTWDTAHAVLTTQLEVLMILAHRILTTMVSHLTPKPLDLLYSHRFRSFLLSHSLYRYCRTCFNHLGFLASRIPRIRWRERVQTRWSLHSARTLHVHGRGDTSGINTMLLSTARPSRSSSPTMQKTQTTRMCPYLIIHFLPFVLFLEHVLTLGHLHTSKHEARGTEVP
ncbi:hypothetical protein DFH29DRAFT_293037 [Suillus ampliporus]|nr:hypothetical protein DFH29DRAFT_293037 [Suillus ampliporus]